MYKHSKLIDAKWWLDYYSFNASVAIRFKNGNLIRGVAAELLRTTTTSQTLQYKLLVKLRDIVSVAGGSVPVLCMVSFSESKIKPTQLITPKTVLTRLLQRVRAIATAVLDRFSCHVYHETIIPQSHCMAKFDFWAENILTPSSEPLLLRLINILLRLFGRPPTWHFAPDSFSTPFYSTINLFLRCAWAYLHIC